MSASPIVSDDLAPVTSGATACDHLRELGNTRDKLQEWFEWAFESDGDLASGFKELLVQQFLFDAAKKGWFVRTNATTGYLELVEEIPLTKLEDGGGVDGDYLRHNGTNWVKVSPIYLAPTSGGSTVPNPDNGGILSVGHGFSGVPKEFRCFLECIADDAGYVVGDRLDAHSLMQQGSGGEIRKAVTVGANSTLVFAVFIRDGSAARTYRLPNKASTWGESAIDPAKWNVKFYAML